MTAVEAFAPAKINLTLHVTRRRDDGYHEIDSLVAFADVGDTVTYRDAGTRTARLSVTGPERNGVPEDGSNLVLRAIGTMAANTSPTIILEKNLPAASGIGGGSSDAAAAMRAMARALGLPLPNARDTDAMGAFARALGADVPMCIDPRPWRARGIGEILEPAEIPPLHAVLANPRHAIPTGSVFSRLASTENAPMSWPPAMASTRAFLDWLVTTRNDLQAPARRVAPVIDHVLDRLARLPGADLARMSGSGATCFALFESADAAGEAARILRVQEPDWWVRSASLGDMRDRASAR